MRSGGFLGLDEGFVFFGQAGTGTLASEHEEEVWPGDAKLGGMAFDSGKSSFTTAVALGFVVASCAFHG